MKIRLFDFVHSPTGKLSLSFCLIIVDTHFERGDAMFYPFEETWDNGNTVQQVWVQFGLAVNSLSMFLQSG